jgi:hypothetical protein
MPSHQRRARAQLSFLTDDYLAAKRGLIPTIRIGGRIRVPVVALERMLESAGNRAEGSKLTAA